MLGSGGLRNGNGTGDGGGDSLGDFLGGQGSCRGEVRGFGSGQFSPIEVVERASGGVKVYVGKSDFDVDKVFIVAKGEFKRACQTVFGEATANETTLDLEGGLVDDRGDGGKVGCFGRMRKDKFLGDLVA